jgi:hypothetical protein
MIPVVATRLCLAHPRAGRRARPAPDRRGRPGDRRPGPGTLPPNTSRLPRADQTSVPSPSSHEIGAPDSAGCWPGAGARARATAPAASLAVDVVEVDRVGRRASRAPDRQRCGRLGVQPLDCRVSHRRCRAHVVVGRWAKRGRPRSTAESLEPSALQLQLDARVRDQALGGPGKREASPCQCSRAELGRKRVFIITKILPGPGHGAAMLRLPLGDLGGPERNWTASTARRSAVRSRRRSAQSLQRLRRAHHLRSACCSATFSAFSASLGN